MSAPRSLGSRPRPTHLGEAVVAQTQLTPLSPVFLPVRTSPRQVAAVVLLTLIALLIGASLLSAARYEPAKYIDRVETGSASPTPQGC